jgi:aryl-alcohol dehydrogenase-like predicted oxidoreductase
MIDRMPFGRTGHHSSRVIFGAAALGSMRQERADAVLAVLPEFGVNHIDTAASYGDSELRLQPWLADHRHEVFLATKTGERTGAEARSELERSLERLGVDRVDLIQMHNLVEPEEWDTAMGPGGALEALARARDEGLTGAIGVTGHGARIAGMHLRSLQRFDFDSVLLPYNFTMMANPQYRDDVERLLELCAERNVAVQTIKSVAQRRWRDDDTEPRRSWYRPLPDGEALDRAVAYVLGRPQLFLNSSSDAGLLRPILSAASRQLTMPSDEDMRLDTEAHDIAPLFDGEALERI